MRPDFFEPPPRHVPRSEPDLARPVTPASLRTVRDREGLRWLVYEWTASELSPLAGRRFLVFDGVSVVRRLTDFPAEWVLLSDEALLGLMWSGPP